LAFETQIKEKGGDPMAVNFFDREVKKLQKRFNNTFGTLVVCNLTLRYSAILAICWLGVLRRRIKETRDREKARDYIREFVEGRAVLNDFFSSTETHTKGGEMRERKGLRSDTRRYARISSA
jgi:hypothetical protein